MTIRATLASLLCAHTPTEGAVGETCPTPAETAAMIAAAADPATAALLSDPGSATSAALAMVAASPTNAVNPDRFPGATDAAKLQNAISYAIANGYRPILVSRWFDLTGAAPLIITKPIGRRQVVRFVGAGGGIRKDDAGAIFTGAAGVSDVWAVGVDFASIPGAGTIVWDCDKLVLVNSEGCTYRGVDRVVSQTAPAGYLQSVRFHRDHITGGSGPAFTFVRSFDTTFDDVLIEHREGGIWHAQYGDGSGVAHTNLRITKCLIEGLSGAPLKLSSAAAGLTIESCYFEASGDAATSQIDLYTVAPTARAVGIMLASNTFTLKAAQIAARTPAILHGQMAPSFWENSIGNTVSDGFLHGFGHATAGAVIGSGEYAPNGLVLPWQEERYHKIGDSSAGTTARPWRPRLGQQHFDTTLNKPVWVKTVGSPYTATYQITAGASTTGTITLTMEIALTVSVTAGDSVTQVRDKIVAAASAPTSRWRAAAIGADHVQLVSNRNRTGTPTFNGAATGVTATPTLTIAGLDNVWVDATGVTT